MNEQGVGDSDVLEVDCDTHGILLSFVTIVKFRTESHYQRVSYPNIVYNAM